MHVPIALLAASLIAANGGMSDAEVREHAEALLGAIDRPIAAEAWRALGPAAVPVLEEVATSGGQMPTTRSAALGALAAVDPVRAEPLARALLDDDSAPPVVRETAVRALGRVLEPSRLRAALAPVLRAARSPGLRTAAAETLARQAGADACAEVMDQISMEPAAGRPAFHRAAALCSGRR
jgi:HEAT repeat protein